MASLRDLGTDTYLIWLIARRRTAYRQYFLSLRAFIVGQAAQCSMSTFKKDDLTSIKPTSID